MSPCTAGTAKLASARALKAILQEPTAEDPPEAVNSVSSPTLSLTENTGPLDNTRWRAARKLARARGESGDGDASVIDW